VPGQIVTGHPLFATFVIALGLFGGLALLLTAVSAGFGEEGSSHSLDLGRNRFR
jgi:hypothetical protein